MQIGVPLGTISGFLISSLSIQILLDWKYALYFQIVVLTLCLLYYGFSDKDQFSIQIREEKDESKSISTVLLQNCKTFFQNPLFVLSMLTLSQLFFVLTGVQFWITDYLNSIMLMEYNLATQSFLIISITAPLIGVYLGSQVLNNDAGNKGFRVMKIAAIEIFLASISLTLIPFFDNQGMVVLLVWCLLFFGSSAIPSIMGIMITSLQREEKSYGNQLSHLFFDLFGYLPAPAVYGYVQQITGGSTSRKGIIMFSYISFLSLIFLLLGIYKKYNHIRQIQLDINESEFRSKLRSLSHHSGDNNDEYEKKDFQYRFQQQIFISLLQEINNQIELIRLSQLRKIKIINSILLYYIQECKILVKNVNKLSFLVLLIRFRGINFQKMNHLQYSLFDKFFIYNWYGITKNKKCIQKLMFLFAYMLQLFKSNWKKKFRK